MRAFKIEPAVKRLVLLGGGHSHAIALREYALRPVANASVTLISDTAHAPYSGMVPGYVAGVYGFGDIHIDLPRLCRIAGVEFVQARATGLDLVNRCVIAGASSIPFDVLSINVGINPAAKDVPGAKEHAVRVKPVSELLSAVDALANGQIVVVGGGAGGVELALALRARLGGKALMAIICSSAEIMPNHAPRVRRLLTRELAAKRIVVHAGSPAGRVDANVVTLANGAPIPFDRLFWATQAAAPEWLAAAGLACTPKGFVRVAPTLASISHPDVFAAGDIAAVEGYALPKSGVYAVREGLPLSANLRRALAGEPLAPFSPQRHALALIATGDGQAVASRASLAVQGRWLWWLKDRIDRQFMAQFGDDLERKIRGARKVEA